MTWISKRASQLYIAVFWLLFVGLFAGRVIRQQQQPQYKVHVTLEYPSGFVDCPDPYARRLACPPFYANETPDFYGAHAIMQPFILGLPARLGLLAWRLPQWIELEDK